MPNIEDHNYTLIDIDEVCVFLGSPESNVDPTPAHHIASSDGRLAATIFSRTDYDLIILPGSDVAIRVTKPAAT